MRISDWSSDVCSSDLFGRPFRSTSMVALVEEATGVDFLAIPDAARARDAARSLQVPIGGKENWGQVVEAVFGEKVEHTLVRPTHVTDFPREISPLANAHRNDPRLNERFETYVHGWELAHALSELSDRP